MEFRKGVFTWTVVLMTLTSKNLPAADMDLTAGAIWEGGSPQPLLVDVSHNGHHAGTAIIARHPYTGDVYIGLDTLAATLMIERDAHTLVTPLGVVEVAENLVREMDGREMAPARALAALLASDIRFNRREFLLEMETPWPRHPPASEVVRPGEERQAESRAAGASLSRLRTELWHRRLDDRELSRSRTDVEGRLASGLWRARVRDWLDDDAYFEDYQWLYPGDNQRLLLGHQRVSANPVTGTMEMTGGQYAWTNRPQAVFTPYLRASSLTGMPARALRSFEGEGPPGGRAELRIDGRLVAIELVALDGRWEFRDVELSAEGASLVEVWLYERGDNGTPVAIEDMSGFFTRRLNPAGTIVLQGAAGGAGNLIEDDAGDAVGFFRAGYAPSDRLNVEVLGQRDEYGDYAGAGAGVMAGPLGFASVDAARGGDRQAWRAEIENQTRHIFWRGYWRREQSGWRGRNEALADRYGEFGVQAGRDLTLSLVGRDLELGARRTRFLRPAMAWRLNRAVYLRARPDSEGRYLANAGWRLSARHSASASYHRSESGVRWDYRLGRRDLVSLSAVDRRGVGERTALIWQRYGWERRQPGWAVGAMAGNGEAGFLLRADYEIFSGVRLRGELLRDPLGPFRANGRPDTALTFSLVADLLLTRRGPVRGHTQHPLSTRGNLAGRVRHGAAIDDGGDLEDLGVLVDGRLAGRTDDRGGYTLANLRPGVYAVSLDPEGLPIDLVPPARSVLVEIAAGAVTRLDFELERSLGMEGLIYDGDGETASGAQLRFLDENGDLAGTARSDAFGRWMATGLRPGSYAIQLERDGRWTEIRREVLADEWLFDIKLTFPQREEES